MSLPMWSTTSHGIMHWSDEAKMLMMRYIRQNMIILNERAPMVKRNLAWDNVYNKLVEAGMPKLRRILVCKVWSNLRAAALRARVQHEGSSNPIPLKKTFAAAIELLERSANLFGTNSRLMSTLKLEPKIEPPSEEESEEEEFNEHIIIQPRILNKNQNQQTHHSRQTIQNRQSNQNHEINHTHQTNQNSENEKDDMQPLVMMEPMQTRTATATCQEQEEYWTIMKQVAENDLQLKLAQRENEEERMEFARDLHRKNMILADMKIKVQNLQIQAYETAPEDF